MNAAEDDHLRAGLGRLLREPQRIAHEIRHVLDFRPLIIMGQNHSLQLAFQRPDFLRDGRGLGGGHARVGLNVCKINHESRLTPQSRRVNEPRAFGSG